MFEGRCLFISGALFFMCLKAKENCKKGKSTYSSNHLQSSRGNGRPPWPKRGGKWVQCTSGLKKKNEKVDTMSRNWQHRLTTNRVAFTKKLFSISIATTGDLSLWLKIMQHKRRNLQGVFFVNLQINSRLTVKSTKYFWLFSPTQLLTQGQWWSIFRMQRLQTL